MSRNFLLIGWDALYTRTRVWAIRQARTLSAKYSEAKPGKIQVRIFGANQRFALWCLGWDCFARLVGDRWQLVYRPCDPVREAYTVGWIAQLS